MTAPASSSPHDLDALDAESFAHPRACANCQTPLVGAYCHACGQPAHVHRTAGALLHDIGHGVFHFEGTVWRTLPLLLWQPGALTRRYVAGERARFVSPMALYLFCVFVMYTVLGLGAHHGVPVEGGGGGKPKPVATATNPNAGLHETRITRTGFGPGETVVTRDGKTVTEQKAVQEALDNLHQSSPYLDAVVRQFVADPELAFYKLKTTAYKYSWLLIPLSLPFVWLLFPFSRAYGLYDHAIFVTYSLSFVTLLLVLLAVLGRLGVPDDPLFFAALLIVPAHMYRQLRGAYGLTKAGAAWRLVGLLCFVAVVLGLFAGLLAWLGLL